MGGGGLRLLPHKKWHVWRRDNIERVLRDEREQEEQTRVQEEKERRLGQERRAQQLLPPDGHGSQHVNLFQAEEAQANSRKTEKKKDETLRRHGKVPWYAQSEDAKKPTEKQEKKRKRELEAADPLQHMRPKEDRPLVAGRRDKEARRERVNEGEGPADSDRRKYSGRHYRSAEEDKLLKRRKHKSSKKEALLLNLRRERDEREVSERQRADRVMYG